MNISGTTAERDAATVATPSISEFSILVCAPTGRDETVLGQVLGEADLAWTPCGDASDLAERMAGAGAVVLTAEAMTGSAVSLVNKAIEAQPVWSKVPLILLLHHAQPALCEEHRSAAMKLGAYATVLTRPVAPATLITVLRSALAARQWQYRVRDAMAFGGNVIRFVSDANAVLEASKVQQQTRLRGAALEVMIVEERERRRLAHVLHDEYQQLLAGALMHLAKIKVASTPQDTQATVQAVKDIIRQSIGTARLLAKDLSPPILDERGLASTLRWLGEQMRDQHELVVDVEAGDDIDPMDPNIRSFLYQTVRELLFNVVKHAQIGRARVVAMRVDQGLRIIVEDRGVGMPADASLFQDEDSDGFGLACIKHRLEMLGGRLELQTSPGQGCRITAITPDRLPNPLAH